MYELLGQLVVGWLIADLASGVFHWWEDRVGYETTPFLGQRVVHWNRIHHANPGASLQGNFWYRNQDSLIATFLIGALLWILIGWSAVLFSFVVGLGLSTQVHYWTHHPPKNEFLKMLQATGLIQHPKHHSVHHSGKQDRRYCVLTNVLNPPLDHWRIWTRLEIFLYRLGFRVSLGLG